MANTPLNYNWQAPKTLLTLSLDDTTLYVKRNATGKKTEYPLSPVTTSDVLVSRLSGKTGIVLKVGKLLYFSEIPKDIHLVGQTQIGRHLCSNCQNMSAAADCDGGCAKVRDPNFIQRNDYVDILSKMIASKRVEKYDFVLDGIEVFNSEQDALLIRRCANYLAY